MIKPTVSGQKRPAATETSPTKACVKKRRISVIPGWADIPEWNTRNSPLLDMPVEILDQIFSPESGLKLQDHMALAGTCRRIRQAYTGDIWKALSSSSYSSIGRVPASHIFSTAWSKNSESRVVESSDNYECSLQAQIAGQINSQMITTSEGRSSYKLTENEILSIPFDTKRNPHGRGAAPMKLFCVARVYALAMRVHGGPQGHQVHLKKLADKSTKAKATREKNGTVPKKKSSTSRRIPRSSSGMADDYNGYDDYIGYGDYEGHDGYDGYYYEDY